MNEYIILNKLTYEATDRIVPAKYLVPLKELIYWEPYYKGGTYVYLGGEFHKGTLHVKESPAEIEALIMGYELPEFDEVDDSCKNEPTFSLREINALKDDIEKLKEENSKLKEEIKNYKHTCAEYHSYWGAKTNEVVNLEKRLEHSNPANPCCRETYLKARELSWKRATSYEPKLKNCLFACTEWEIEFDRKIQEIKEENKND